MSYITLILIILKNRGDLKPIVGDLKPDTESEVK